MIALLIVNKSFIESRKEFNALQILFSCFKSKQRVAESLNYCKKIIVYMLLRFICAYTVLLRGQLHYWCLQSLSGCRVQGTQHCSKLTIRSKYAAVSCGAVLGPPTFMETLYGMSQVEGSKMSCSANVFRMVSRSGVTCPR